MRFIAGRCRWPASLPSHDLAGWLTANGANISFNIPARCCASALRVAASLKSLPSLELLVFMAAIDRNIENDTASR
jgi:hypothetical protein